MNNLYFKAKPQVTPFTGGTIANLTVTGNTIVDGLTATTISATTYQNLPLDVFVTGGTYSNGVATFTSNSGETFNVSGFYTGETSYVNSLTTGTGLSANTTTGDITIINTSPDQIVTISGGTGILTGGTYPNFTIENTLPDQTVVLNNGTNISVTGTYPTFTIDVTGLTDNNTYTTGFTYQDNTFTISDSSGNTFPATINVMTGLTINGTLSATTISGGTLYGDGSNLTGLSTGLNVGTTQITNGTSGRILFQSGTTLQQDGSLFWNITNGRLSIGQGSSPGARLDVRAQGVLSTDIAFRVRNSTDTFNILTARGNGVVDFQNTIGGTFLSIGQVGASNSNDGFLDFSGSRGIRNRAGGVVQLGIRIFHNSTIRSTGLYISATEASGDNTIFIDGGQNIRIGQGFSNTNQPDANATRTIQVMNGVAPTTSVVDGFQQYSADITAGNAAPHFRTENGSIVKLYQETTAITGATLVGGGGTTITDTDTFDGYTIQQVVKALRNLGVLQ
jgi:hypothetical protein